MGRVLVTVAAETGTDVLDLMDRPLWLTLYTFHHLEEREERRAMVRRMERVDAGLMTAHAFNEPAKLADELRAVRDAIDAYEYGASVPEDAGWDEARARVAAWEAASDRMKAALAADGRTPDVTVLS